jgi:hypothetical protein
LAVDIGEFLNLRDHDRIDVRLGVVYQATVRAALFQIMTTSPESSVAGHA